MKIIEGIVKIALWIAFIIGCMMIGWLWRGYKARKETI